jgi:uroporphyrinogen-III decarboxylase
MRMAGRRPSSTCTAATGRRAELEDRHGGWGLAQARAHAPSKCLVGGIDHVAVMAGGAALVRAQALDAIAATAGRGLVLSPGCTFLPGTPQATMHALKDAAVEAAKAR